MKRMDAPDARWISHRQSLLALFLVAATVVAYLSVWHAGFIWDDDAHLTKNPCIVGPIGFKGIWTTAAATYYPLVLTSFWIQHAIWGLNPLPYHLVNVAMHAACAILLWQVLLRLQIKGAWLGAAIWALHPVQVESVAWITELKNTQSCLFYLLSILFFLRWQESNASLQDRHIAWRSYVVSLLCALAAILSKSSTVMLPVVLVLCWWWIDGRWPWRNTIRLMPFLLISVLAAAWTIWEQKFHNRAVGADWNQTMPERFIIAGRVMWFYLGKLLWPYPLVFIYPRWQIDASQPLQYLPTLGAIAGLITLWWKRNGPLRPLFFAAMYFVISLFPVLDFFDVYFFRYSFVGDHLQYLASIGPLILIAAGIAAAFDLLTKVVFPKAIFCAALLCLLAVVSWKQVGIYRDQETLWFATLDKNPDFWMVQNSVASILLQKGKVSEALTYLKKISRPDNVVTQTNLGNALFQLGDTEGAYTHLLRAIELDPTYVVAYSNMSSILFRKGLVEESVACLEKALEIDPYFLLARFNLANALLQMHRAREALFHLQRAIEIAPGDAEAQKNLAWIMATCPEQDIRNGARAVELAERANELTKSKDPIFLVTLGAAYAEVGRFNEATETAEKALQLADATGSVSIAELIRKQLYFYRSHQPFRDIR
jgi:protein O-mannosyl-transferase